MTEGHQATGARSTRGPCCACAYPRRVPGARPFASKRSRGVEVESRTPVAQQAAVLAGAQRRHTRDGRA